MCGLLRENFTLASAELMCSNINNIRFLVTQTPNSLFPMLKKFSDLGKSTKFKFHCNHPDGTVSKMFNWIRQIHSLLHVENDNLWNAIQGADFSNAEFQKCMKMIDLYLHMLFDLFYTGISPDAKFTSESDISTHLNVLSTVLSTCVNKFPDFKNEIKNNKMEKLPEFENKLNLKIRLIFFMSDFEFFSDIAKDRYLFETLHVFKLIATDSNEMVVKAFICDVMDKFLKHQINLIHNKITYSADIYFDVMSKQCLNYITQLILDNTKVNVDKKKIMSVILGGTVSELKDLKIECINEDTKNLSKVTFYEWCELLKSLETNRSKHDRNTRSIFKNFDANFNKDYDFNSDALHDLQIEMDTDFLSKSIRNFLDDYDTATKKNRHEFNNDQNTSNTMLALHHSNSILIPLFDLADQIMRKKNDKELRSILNGFAIQIMDHILNQYHSTHDAGLHGKDKDQNLFHEGFINLIILYGPQTSGNQTDIFAELEEETAKTNNKKLNLGY
jgi:hypothetical protein